MDQSRGDAIRVGFCAHCFVGGVFVLFRFFFGLLKIKFGGFPTAFVVLFFSRVSRGSSSSLPRKAKHFSQPKEKNLKKRKRKSTKDEPINASGGTRRVCIVCGFIGVQKILHLFFPFQHCNNSAVRWIIANLFGCREEATTLKWNSNETHRINVSSVKMICPLVPHF